MKERVECPNSVTRELGYDVMDRIAEIAWSGYDCADVDSREYSYDNADNIVSIATANGTTIDYVYDGIDRLAGESKAHTNGVPLRSAAYNFASVAGQIAGGLVPVWGQIADARDTLASAKKVWDNPGCGDAWIDFGSSLAGWIPGLGDMVKGGRKLSKAAKRARKVAKSTNRRANKQIDDIAKRFGINRDDSGDYIHGRKANDHRGGADNYSWRELEEMANEYFDNGGR